MPLASVDTGSNSVRLLIGEVSGGRVRGSRYERATTRLASGIEETGLISGPAMHKTIDVLRNYAAIIGGAGVSHVKCVGTSALREAGNSEDFIERVKREAGMDVEVVSGHEEAELTAMGVVSSLKVGPSSLILDIGGGSTELMLLGGREVMEVFTLPVGALKLLERHVRTDPPSEAEMLGLDEEAGRTAEMLFERLGDRVGEGTELMATAGTATTLAAIDMGLERYDREKVHGHKIPLLRLHEISGMLSAMPLGKRAEVNGLEPERADLIITGVRLTIRLMESLGFQVVLVSDHGLLEGALLGLSREVSR
jgi:exopolyphosphatase/guanosine-5'-triphosphate,3'-diphosphate pyrophosphatase